jgi:hypothetical protein
MKNLTKLFLLVLVFGLFISSIMIAQVSGDYRSAASGNWDALATWQTYDGAVWNAATVKPGSTSNVYIQATHLVTLTMNEACNDIHLASAASPNYGRVATVTFTLEVNGKIRTYTGTIPGTNVSSPVNPPFTKSAAGSSGLVKIVGNSRNVTNTGEFGSFSAVAPSTNASIEIAMNSGQTATFQTAGKFASWAITTGTLDFTGRLSVDFGTTTLGNVTVSSGATLISNSSGTIMSRTSSGLGGVFTLDGTLILKRMGTLQIGMTTINFNGTVQYDTIGAQSMLTAITGGASPNTYNNLTLSGSGAKSLGLSTTVNGTLLFGGSAIAQLGTFNMALGSSSTISGASAANYIDVSSSGIFQRSIAANGTYDFPVANVAYSPVSLTLSGASFSSASIAVDAFNTKHTLNTSSTDYLNRYWNVTVTGITGGSYNADFVYVDGDVAGTETNITLGQHNGVQWNVVGSVDAGTNTLSATGLTSFSDFTGGEASALPIQLASFVGSYVGNNAKLEWSTISEVNNYGFNVQRLNEISKNFETVGFVAGKGTTLEPQSYEYIDANPSTSYRLEQIDNDGLTTYYGPIMLNPNSVGDNVPAVFALNQNYPNPFNPTTNITFSLANSGYTTLKVYNILGNEVATLFNGNGEAGKLYIIKFDATKLSTGMYIYKLQNGNNVEVRKLTLVK